MAASAAKAILDTSVYLSFLRKNFKIVDLAFLLRPTLLYMSRVVFAELYAGAKDRFTIRQLERVYRIFARLDRLAIPDKQVWFETGQVLRQLGARHGFETIGLSPITHDVLIALTARARSHRLQPKLQRLQTHSRDKRFSSAWPRRVVEMAFRSKVQSAQTITQALCGAQTESNGVG
jgi:predicted nucleic acid-binding protein